MSVTATRSARFALLQLELPRRGLMNAGVLLEDPATDHAYLRLRRDWEQIAPEESEVLMALEADLSGKAQEMGAAKLIEYLCNTLSNTLRISDPQETFVADFNRSLARLYRENVQSTVERFVTHLPRYTLAVAAGKFLENQEIGEEGWDEAPQSMRLDERMFVAHIVGQSMEPRIPDGSLCVFRSGVTGSRQGRLVLVESLGGGANDRYTVKRYKSEKRQMPDGTWGHEHIVLEPLNPELEAWELNPEEERYRIVAEFVDVLA